MKVRKAYICVQRVPLAIWLLGGAKKFVKFIYIFSVY